MQAIKNSLFILVALSLFAVTTQVNAKPAKAKKVVAVAVITGHVTPEMDKRGKVKQASITTEDGTVYRVVMNKTGKKLAATQSDVTTEVSGTVKMKKNKKAKNADEAWVTVKSFKAAPTAPPEDEGDEAIEEGEGEEVYED